MSGTQGVQTVLFISSSSLRVNLQQVSDNQGSYLGYQTSDSASSSKFPYLALLVALVSHSSNFHNWPLFALLVALLSHRSNLQDWPLLALLVTLVLH